MRVTKKINNNIYDGNCSVSITKETNNVVKFSTVDFIITKENYTELLDKLKESIEKLLEIQKPCIVNVSENNKKQNSDPGYRAFEVTSNNLSKPKGYEFVIDGNIKLTIHNNPIWDGRYYHDHWVIKNINHIILRKKFNYKHYFSTFIFASR